MTTTPTPILSAELGARVLEKLETIDAQLRTLSARQREQEERSAELWADATALAKVAMTATTERLDALERDGTLGKVRELASVAQEALAGFSAADVRELRSSIVAILEAVRALTQPAVLAVAADAAGAIEHAGEVKPIGIFGVVKATRDDDVQKGMAVLFEIMRRIGHAATAASARDQALAGKRARLNEVLGSKRRKVLGVERPKALPAPSAAAKAAPKAAPAAAPACSTPKPPGPATTVIDGVGFGADGHLVDPAAWTRELAGNLAALSGITLTEAHWKLLEAARAEFTASGVSPNIRRLTEVAGVTTRDIYQLFPKAPGRTLAKVAGLPKPAGCL